MLLKDFFDLYQQRKGEKDSFRQICRENNISYKKLKPALKHYGFAYDPKAADWILSDDALPEADQIMQLDLSVYTMRAPRQQTEDTEDDLQQQTDLAASMRLESSDHDAQQPSLSPVITAQLFDVVDLLQQINAKLPAAVAASQVAATVAADPITDDAPLALRLHMISQSLKARKTINISSTCAGWLDRYSTTKGFHIGDLVTLAVTQLQERIDPDNE